MDYSPRLQRQRSRPCPPLDWCGSRRRTAGFTRTFADDYSDDDEFDPSDYSPVRSAGPGWRGLWRRFMKKGGRLLKPSGSVREPYDPYTYAQNFDDGSAWVEPENLSRSFSARFAVPSRVLQRVG